MKVTLLDKQSQVLTHAYIPLDKHHLPEVLIWDGRIFTFTPSVDPVYIEASYYSVPLATCTELPPSPAQTDGIVPPDFGVTP